MSNPESFLVKENEEQIEFNLLRIPKLMKFQDSIDLQGQQEEEFQDRIVLIKGHQENENKQEKGSSLGELKATEEDNDGFQTPDSLATKIPMIKQCPPAPRKPKPLLSTKRKASQSNARRTLQLDLSQEVESLFPWPIRADFCKKMKKARRDY